MMWRDAKYLIAYVAPLAAYLGIYLQGAWSFGSIYVGFALIPLLEFFLPQSVENIPPEEEPERESSLFFDLLLYLNIPILYGLIIYYFDTLGAGGLAIYEIVGMTLSVGLIVGTIGINVAHELGHRSTRYEQLMSKVLLLSALYTHFFIEHNRGHHKNVATDEDPASARLGESLYAFWWRSVTGSYRNAWQLERERLEKQGKPVLSWENEMVRFTIYQILYLLAIGLLWGWYMTGYAAAIAVVGFLMLESVNYIEHYGLRRQKMPNGRYERVSPLHSWNSGHELGRIFLYELTRHSDHHYKATRKYQVLRHFDDSPQLPMGYPAAILLSLAPPVWFQVMDKKVKELSKTDVG
ncbi:MAG: alkane 1-monooxygenase [Phaeodactylibacter sp.]|nr:alkane 1-monooxygenase [Phaeodactylibacter sp.]